LECADQSALWSVATCRDSRGVDNYDVRGGTPARTKAATGGVPGAAAALGCSRRRTPKSCLFHKENQWAEFTTH
jgi:hypothetical protein